MGLLLPYRQKPENPAKILDRCAIASEEHLWFSVVTHEVIHLKTLGLAPQDYFKGYLWLENQIKRLPKAEQEENELRTMAAELHLFRPLGVTTDEDKYLHAWERVFKIPGLRDTVIRLSTEPRTTQDANDAIQFALECQAILQRKAA